MSKPIFPPLAEPLEARLTPDVVIGAGGRTATFTDIDGDDLRVREVA